MIGGGALALRSQDARRLCSVERRVSSRPWRLAMTEARRSVPRLAGVSILALGLAASPIAIDFHPMKVGKNVAFAQGGGGGGGGGGPGGHGGSGAGPVSGDQGARQGMGMQQGRLSQGGMTQQSQSGVTQQMQGQVMDRETIRSVQRRLNQLGYHAGPEDEIMGPKTSEAIWAYQNRMGMAPDGMLSPDLVDRIMAGSAEQNAK